MTVFQYQWKIQFLSIGYMIIEIINWKDFELNVLVYDMLTYIAQKQFYDQKSRAQCQQEFFFTPRLKKKKRKKRLHSNLFCLPEDLNCLLSNPRAKTNASQTVSPLSVYTHSAQLPSFLRFYITMTNCLTNIVGWITHVTFWIWKMCACESFHCRSAHAKDTS